MEQRDKAVAHKDEENRRGRSGHRRALADMTVGKKEIVGIDIWGLLPRPWSCTNIRDIWVGTWTEVLAFATPPLKKSARRYSSVATGHWL